MESGSQNRISAYLQSLLTGVGTIFLALLTPTFMLLVRDMAKQHATGLTVVADGILESFLSPYFWILFVCFFSIFYLARRSQKQWKRVLLFWIPTILATIVGFAFWGLLLYVTRSIRRF